MDAMPRAVDVTSSLGLDAQEFADQCAEEVLNQHPEAYANLSKRAIASIAQDTVRHLDHLGLAIEQDETRVFTEYICWIARVLFARGVQTSQLIEHVKVLKSLLDKLLEGNLAVRVEGILNHGLNALRNTRVEDASGVPLDERVRATGNIYLQSLLNGNRYDAVTAIDEGFRQGLTGRDVYLGIFQPVMHEIGHRWERNELTVAQEHVATAITQYAMAHSYSHLLSPGQFQSKGSIAMMGVAGELHEIGLRMVSDFLEANGWEVTYFGTNMPADDIVHTISTNPPAAVGVSVTMSFNIRAAAELIQCIRATTTLNACRIIVGGAAFRFNPESWQPIGADGWGRDAENAIEALEAMVGQVRP